MFLAGGGPPAPGGDLADPVLDGIEAIYGKGNVIFTGIVEKGQEIIMDVRKMEQSTAGPSR